MNKRDTNIWGKKCKCGSIVFEYFPEHVWVEEDICKEVICPKCNNKVIITKEEASSFYNNLIYDCFNDCKGKVLDIGCGGGLLTSYLLNKKDVTKVVCVDIDDDTPYKENFLKLDLNNFDENIFNDHFDYVVCRDVLMHLNDIDYTFNKLSKISDKVILLNWYDINHKNCINKTHPVDILGILKKYYRNIEISYPEFYKYGYLIKNLNKINIEPKKEVIDKWIKEFVPSYDVWFFKEKPKFSNVIGIDEYLEKFSSLEYINAYYHWEIKKKAKYVVVDNTNWILTLKDDDRNMVYKEQILLDRGLILDLEKIGNDKNLQSMIYENKIIVSKYLFYKLKDYLKQKIVIEYAKENDDWIGYEYNYNNYLSNIVNTFVGSDGSNCLGITLFAVTNNKNYLNKWVKEKEFEKVLIDNNYKEIEDTNYNFGDVLVFYKDGLVIHACFSIDYKLFVNKNGQSKYNPITISSLDDIINEWGNADYKHYRKNIITIYSN